MVTMIMYQCLQTESNSLRYNRKTLTYMNHKDPHYVKGKGKVVPVFN
jgi:hypothetical protein